MANTREAKANKETKSETQVLQYSLGRRKRAIARVRMFAGKGESLINGRTLKEYAQSAAQLNEFLKPLNLANMTEDHYFTAKVIGGGVKGQLEAVQLGVARCISKVNEDLKKVMREKGYLTRDPREKERKKIYHLGARKGPQFSKR